MPATANTTATSALYHLKQVFLFIEGRRGGAPVRRSELVELTGLAPRTLNRILATARQAGLPVTLTTRKKLYAHSGKHITLTEYFNNLAELGAPTA